MNRHEQRIKIFQILFQLDHEVVTLEESAFYNLYLQHEYMARTVDFYMDNKDSVDDDISHNLTNYTLERISKVDRNILRTAVSELNISDAPVRVVINEAIKLAKNYGDNDSYKFINGVLKNFAGDNG